MIHFRDDKLIGEKINKHFEGSSIDYTKWECWQTGSLCWALHSYLGYLDQNMLSKMGVEIAIINDGGQVTKKMIRCIGSEVFRDSRIHRLTALISPENKQASKFVRIVGFTYEGTLRKVDKGKDISIFSLFEEEYKERWEAYSHQRR